MTVNAYFDWYGKPNLKHLVTNRQGNPWIVHDHSRAGNLTRMGGFKICVTDKDFNHGIYMVSVREHSPVWSGFQNKGSGRHILYEIPRHILNAAQNKEVIIVIDNQEEGFPLIYQGCDGYREMHTAMTNLKLPRDSVIFINGDKKFESDYHRWCADNNTRPLISHVYFFTHLHYFFNRRPTYPLVLDAIKRADAKDFSSLNRTNRPNRLDHLYTLITSGLHKHGLVSGHWRNAQWSDINQCSDPMYIEVDREAYRKVLFDNLPLIIDGDWSDMHGPSPDYDDNTIFNFDIYKNSLLSFVTETAFHWPGMFFTEKVLKPIAAGHPFIVLGQYGLLEELKEMGYITDFPGVDQSYDKINDPYKRFEAAHRSLESWIKIPRAEKANLILQSVNILQQNMSTFNNSKYDRDSYQRLKEKVIEIFNKGSQ